MSQDNHERYRTSTVSKLDRMKQQMQKHMDDMDLDNVDVKLEMQGVIDRIKTDIDNTVGRINGYRYLQEREQERP